MNRCSDSPITAFRRFRRRVLVVTLGLLRFSVYQQVDAKEVGIPVTITGLLSAIFVALAVPLDDIKVD